MKSLSHVQLLVTPWIAAYQAPPSMGFSRQEYWSGVPSPSLIYPEETIIEKDTHTPVLIAALFTIARTLKRRRQWHPTPILLPGKSHGRRSLVGCSPWCREESDMTERLHFHFSLSCIGEGNGNPLQCSSLENPRGGEAWWAAVYGVTQSRTRLK